MVRWVTLGAATVNTLICTALRILVASTAGQRIVIDAIVGLITDGGRLITARVGYAATGGAFVALATDALLTPWTGVIGVTGPALKVTSAHGRIVRVAARWVAGVARSTSTVDAIVTTLAQDRALGVVLTGAAPTVILTDRVGGCEVTPDICDRVTILTAAIDAFAHALRRVTTRAARAVIGVTNRAVCGTCVGVAWVAANALPIGCADGFTGAFSVVKARLTTGRVTSTDRRFGGVAACIVVGIALHALSVDTFVSGRTSKNTLRSILAGTAGPIKATDGVSASFVALLVVSEVAFTTKALHATTCPRKRALRIIPACSTLSIILVTEWGVRFDVARSMGRGVAFRT